MLKVEVVVKVWNTCTLSDEDEEKVVNYIKNNPEEFEFMSKEKAITNAVKLLYYDDEIELYESFVESDCSTEEINWSKYEERDAEEILGN